MTHDWTDIQASRDRYKEALEKIAAMDYRGNMPFEQMIAWEALRFEGSLNACAERSACKESDPQSPLPQTKQCSCT